MTPAKELALWRARLEENWARVSVQAVDGCQLVGLRIGDGIKVRAWVQLGSLSPEDVRAELYLAQVDSGGHIVEAEPSPMQIVDPTSAGSCLLEGRVTLQRKSGLHGYTVRVLPHYPGLTSSFLPGLIAWAHTPGESTNGKGVDKLLR